MSYKCAESNDAQDMIDRLSQIRKTVSTEKDKRLKAEENKPTLRTFKSGQEHARKRY